MKRFVGLLFTLSAVLGAAMLAATAVHADSGTPMTEAHIAQIRSNCTAAQASLTQLHLSDALMRVNRGQLYESISSRLMVPFNSRIAQYTQRNVNLVSLTSTYDGQLTTFSNAYKQYEEAMTKALKIDCKNQPVAFYDAVADARAKRALTHDSVVAIQKTIKDYAAEFEIFAKNFQEGTK